MGILQNLILICILPYVYLDELEMENNVIILNNENFDEIVNVHKPILVAFYAPWCTFSQKLKPHFDEVAQNFQRRKLITKLGKVDVTVETDLADRFAIKQYPTLVLFKEDRQVVYKKAHKYVVISDWLISKVDNLFIEINSTSSLNEVERKYDVLVIVDKAVMSNHLVNISENIDDIQFCTMESQLFQSLFSFDKKTSVVLKRKIDGGLFLFDEEINIESLDKFIKMNELPGVVKYSFEIGGKVFSNPFKYLHLMIFMAENFDAVHTELIGMTKNHPEVSVVLVDVNDNVTDSLIRFFKVDKTKLPHLLLSNIKNKNQFLPDFQEINSHKIDRFLKGVKAGTILPFMKSQPVPDNWDKEPVKVLVGKNFEEVVFDKTKHVFVEIYAPWCGYCKQLEPIWNNLAKELSDVPDLIIAKLDGTENDIKDITWKSFPTLKLILKDTNEIIDYSGARNREQFKEFLSKYLDLNKVKMEL